MSSIWASNRAALKINDSIKMFANRGIEIFQDSIGSTNITCCKNFDNSGLYIADRAFVLLDGFVYDTTPQDIANSLTGSIGNLLEVVNTINGDYALFVETEDFYAAVVDPWGSKNLWINVEGKHISVSSSIDAMKVHHTHGYLIGSNTVLVIQKNDFTIKKYSTKHWNLKQHVNHYDYVFAAIENSVTRRYNKSSIVPLSSGYDSGVIACALSNLGHVEFSVSLKKIEDDMDEDIKVLAERIKTHKGFILNSSNRMTDEEVNDLSVYLHPGLFSPACESWARICKHMKSIGKHNILSGNGGDELYSDYGYRSKQLGEKSLFGGHFPVNLELIWPWHDYLHRQTKPISRLDFLAGYFGIQHKEPLLDIELVQAWLNTTSDLKNRSYKNWMYEYMLQSNYPISVDKKIGTKLNQN